MTYYPTSEHDGHLAVPSNSDYESRFCVQPRVKRSFSFEELQSGSFFESLDESDLQFYRVYGQPVLLPPNDSHDAFALSNNPSPLHYPYLHEPWSLIASDRAPPPFKSYALAGSLGEVPAFQATHPTIPSSGAAYSHAHLAQQPSPAQSLYSSTNPSEYPSIDNSYAQDPSSLSRYPCLDFAYVGHGSNSVSPMTGNADSLMDHLPTPPTTVPSSYFQCSSPQDEKPPFEQTLPIAPQPPQSFTAPLVTESSDWSDGDPKTHTTVPSQAYPGDDPVQASASVAYEQASACDYTTSAQAPRRRTRSPSPRTHQQARASLMAQQLHSKGKSMDKKPALACLFCRGRKIACGPPLPGTKDKTCNQCARRHLKCEYPLESRRGMRKRRSLVPRAGSPSPGHSGSTVTSSAAGATSGTNGPSPKTENTCGSTKALSKGRKRSSDK